MTSVANIDQIFILLATLTTFALSVKKFRTWLTSREKIEILTFGITLLFCIGNLFALKILGELVLFTTLSYTSMILGASVVAYTYMTVLNQTWGKNIILVLVPLSISILFIYSDYLGYLSIIDINYPHDSQHLFYLLIMPITTFIVFFIYSRNFVAVARLAEWGSVRLVSRLVCSYMALLYMLNRPFIFISSLNEFDTFAVIGMSFQILAYTIFILGLFISYGSNSRYIRFFESVYLYIRKYYILNRLQKITQLTRLHIDPISPSDNSDSTIEREILSCLTEIMDFKKIAEWSPQSEQHDLNELLTVLNQVDDNRSDYLGLAYQYSTLKV